MLRGKKQNFTIKEMLFTETLKKKHCFRFVVKPQDLKICKPVRPRQYGICIFFQ